MQMNNTSSKILHVWGNKNFEALLQVVRKRQGTTWDCSVHNHKLTTRSKVLTGKLEYMSLSINKGKTSPFIDLARAGTGGGRL
jgi:hypothetical protein